MFINFSNHPSSAWDQKQLTEAQRYGEVRDISFPSVGAESSSAEIAEMAQRYVDQIAQLNPDCVMCQGEFSLSFAVISRLLDLGIKTVAACSSRDTLICMDGDKTIKTVVFNFKQFRDYIR